MSNLHFPISHTRTLDGTIMTASGIVRWHVPEPNGDPDGPGVRAGLLHWATLIDEAMREQGHALLGAGIAVGPVLPGCEPVGSALNHARTALVALLDTSILTQSERLCVEDLLRFATRAEVRARILRLAMRQADNPHEPFDWMSES